MRSNSIIILLFFLFQINTSAQHSKIVRTDPPFWWIDMKNPKLQLLVYGTNISEENIKIDYPGVNLVQVNRMDDNPDYLFLDIDLDSTAKAGMIKFCFSGKNKQKWHYNYELKERNESPNRNQGIDSKELIYLIMPDRFANGDYKNDIVSGMNEKSVNRDSMYYRHGGDIQGIIDHLDYLFDLGITTIWCTPEVENDQFETSYHGYSVTDHYSIDPRLGTNELYKTYVNECHKRKIKVVKDVVHNHVGSEHWILQDLPMKNWLNQWPAYTTSTYNCEPVMDPYASKSDCERTLKGWMFKTMPDLNEKNEYVQNFLTQNTIWWLEYAGIDALRLDTYFYNNPEYMAVWAREIKKEFPTVTIFAETWVNGILKQAFFYGYNGDNGLINSNLDGITDFQFRESLIKMLNGKPEEWKNNLTPNILMNPVYSTLACDFIYNNPRQNIVFLDNHDLSRIYSILGGNIQKLKSALAVLLTTNRTPQIYYGTEIGMPGLCAPDGLVRSDFPGGWKEDKYDKFRENGRNESENEIYNYFKKLANYRKNSAVLQTGKLMQYFPINNLYVYFRYNEMGTVMVVTNSNDFNLEVNALKYEERIKNFNKAKNIITDTIEEDLTKLNIPSHETCIFELL